MEDALIIGVIVVLILVGVFFGWKHFKGEGGCCGGGKAYISKKKLSHVIGKKTVIVEGMMCDNCKARVARAINDMDGAAVKVNLKKKEAVVSMEREISDDVIREAIEKAGYTVVEIR